MTKSRLQRTVQINYDLLRKYLAALERHGLISRRISDGKDEFFLTPHGFEARQQMIAWLSKVFGSTSK